MGTRQRGRPGRGCPGPGGGGGRSAQRHARTGPARSRFPRPSSAVLTAARTEASPPPRGRVRRHGRGGPVGRRAEPIAQPVNPYKGLRAFDEPDAEDFFGRDAAGRRPGGPADRGRGRRTARPGGGRIRERQVEPGPGGTAASLAHGVAAGAAGWFVAAMVPGHSPFKELAESLRRVAVAGGDGLAGELADGTQGIDQVMRRVVPAGGDLLLVVDQLEELFTLVDDGEQRAFLDGLVHAVTAAGEPAPGGGDPARRLLRPALALRAVRRPPSATAPCPSRPCQRRSWRRRSWARPSGWAAASSRRWPPSWSARCCTSPRRCLRCSSRCTSWPSAARAAISRWRPTGSWAASTPPSRRGPRSCTRSLDDPARDGIRRLFERLVVVSAEGEPTRRRALRTELAAAAARRRARCCDMIEVWAQARLLTLDRHPESRAADRRGGPRGAAAGVAPVARLAGGGPRRDRGARSPPRGGGELGRPGPRSRRPLPGARLDTARQLADGARAPCHPGSGSSSMPAAPNATANGNARPTSSSTPPGQPAAPGPARRPWPSPSSSRSSSARWPSASATGPARAPDRNHPRAGRRGQRQPGRRPGAQHPAGARRSRPARSAGGSALREAEQALHDAVDASRIERASKASVARSRGGHDGAGRGDDRGRSRRHPRPGDRGGTADHRRPRRRVNGVAFSPDGTLVGTTGEDDTAALWDLAAGELLHRFDRPEQRPGDGPTQETGDDSLAPSFSRGIGRASRSPGGASGRSSGWSTPLRVGWCRSSSTGWPSAEHFVQSDGDDDGGCPAVRHGLRRRCCRCRQRQATTDTRRRRTRSNGRGVESRRQVDRGGHRHRCLRLQHGER